MKKIYTGIDLGSFSIKIVVCEVVNNKFHVLAASNVRCKGIQNGLISNIEEVKPYLLKAKQEVEGMLGISIEQAIVTVPSNDVNFDIVEGMTKIESEDKVITSNEINKVFQDAMLGKVREDRELITITPISFQIDDKDAILDPKEMVGEMLSVKAVITTVSKDSFKNVIRLLKECRIEVVDATFGSMGDYYEAKNPEFERSVSSIINIGYEKTEISIFNKGIMIKNKNLDIGSKLIDRDLCYMYRIKRSQAKKIRENFAISNTRYADINDTITLINKNGDEITINQVEVSEIIESRLTNLLAEVKKEINLLTNKEIGYIIITGGISELSGFEYVVENVFDRRCSVLNINTMGIRSNMYSSSYGIIKYFYNKLDLRGLSYTMVNELNAKHLVSKNEKVSSGNIVSKVFGYFSGDREE